MSPRSEEPLARLLNGGQQPQLAVAAHAGKETGPPAQLRERMLAKLLKDGKPTMSLDDAAALLGISRNLIFAAARRNEIPTIRLGKRILVLTVPLAELLCGKGGMAEK